MITAPICAVHFVFGVVVWAGVCAVREVKGVRPRNDPTPPARHRAISNRAAPANLDLNTNLDPNQGRLWTASPRHLDFARDERLGEGHERSIA